MARTWGEKLSVDMTNRIPQMGVREPNIPQIDAERNHGADTAILIPTIATRTVETILKPNRVISTEIFDAQIAATNIPISSKTYRSNRISSDDAEPPNK